MGFLDWRIKALPHCGHLSSESLVERTTKGPQGPARPVLQSLSSEAQAHGWTLQGVTSELRLHQWCLFCLGSSSSFGSCGAFQEKSVVIGTDVVHLRSREHVSQTKQHSDVKGELRPCYDLFRNVAQSGNSASWQAERVDG